jgi:hypothetical protein
MDALGGHGEQDGMYGTWRHMQNSTGAALMRVAQ